MKRGRTMNFYGAFISKKKAKAAERRHSGSFIRRVTVRGHRRFVVMKKRRKG